MILVYAFILLVYVIPKLIELHYIYVKDYENILNVHTKLNHYDHLNRNYVFSISESILSKNFRLMVH